MSSFNDLNLSKQLANAIDELGFTEPTPIQKEAFSVILSGKDVVGIAQTGTGKTFAYLLPILRDLKYSNQTTPRVLILVPTRELVIQVVEQIESLTEFISVRALGVYGGANINVQKEKVLEGTDVLVATPGRLYDLALSQILKLKTVKKLVIDEVDVMFDLGFRFQVKNILDLLPERRQNVVFSATMTEEVSKMIDEYFIVPTKISIALSGTPLENIAQQCYPTENFNTKVNLLTYLLRDKEELAKVLVFVSTKKFADRLFEDLEVEFKDEICIIHSNKTQNYRIRSIQQFNEGKNRILVATDIMARGLDLDKITHVINFDTPMYPENYMHRIGRTGRAKEQGKSILFYSQKEKEAKRAIEALMNYNIPMIDFPKEVEVSKELIPEERQKQDGLGVANRIKRFDETNKAFHEKKDKNKKTNQGGSYLRKKKVYKKPKSKGDKNINRRKNK